MQDWKGIRERVRDINNAIPCITNDEHSLYFSAGVTFVLKGATFESHAKEE
jgi:hypothetical protein